MIQPSKAVFVLSVLSALSSIPRVPPVSGAPATLPGELGAQGISGRGGAIGSRHLGETWTSQVGRGSGPKEGLERPGFTCPESGRVAARACALMSQVGEAMAGAEDFVWPGADTQATRLQAPVCKPGFAWFLECGGCRAQRPQYFSGHASTFDGPRGGAAPDAWRLGSHCGFGMP